MGKVPSIQVQLYLFEGLLFKESILLGQIRGSEAITKQFELSCIRFLKSGHILCEAACTRPRHIFMPLRGRPFNIYMFFTEKKYVVKF
jgi:hypothetical protein